MFNSLNNTVFVHKTSIWLLYLLKKYLNNGNNLIAHSRSVFKGLLVIIKNLFPYGENEWSFYFGNRLLHTILINTHPHLQYSRFINIRRHVYWILQEFCLRIFYLHTCKSVYACVCRYWFVTHNAESIEKTDSINKGLFLENGSQIWTIAIRPCFVLHNA